MNKIYINGRFLSQDITGVQRYALEICKDLKEKGIDFVILAPVNIKDEYLTFGLPIEIVRGLKGHLWEQVTLPFFLWRKKITRLVNFCNTAPVLFKGNLVVLHDMAFFRFPNNFSKIFLYSYRTLIPIIYRRSVSVFTVSDFSKNEIEFFLGRNKKIVVMPCGLTHFKEIRRKENVKDSYFLAVSSRSPHKNFSFLISSFLKANVNGAKLKIVGSGNSNFSTECDDHQDASVEFLGRVSDETLGELYKGALAFVFPSYYEGFGIPPLEAQCYQCPVIASNAASLPEVLSDSAMYIDPYDQDSLTEKIEVVFQSEELRKDLIIRGNKNVMRFSWSKSTDIFLSEMERIE
ncbi:glycosyltransferase family 1 protein [Marinomonas arenicola]|uniref:glycosyltransferase family 4 protein n=1 Tax=Marinomonas arenicola TaxID=569601 RepID=UPI00311F77FD